MQDGIVGAQAPELRVDDWIDGQGQAASPWRLADHAGSVRVLYCFQAWCPGCHSYGFPTLKALTQRFAGEDVQFAVIQTVFEGHDANGPERRSETQRQYELPLPFGQDAAQPLPHTMADYQSGGTPWFIVIDRQGQVVASDFRPQGLERVIEKALRDG